MNLAEKLARWKELSLELDGLKAEIMTEVMALEKSQEAGGVRATYSQGKGSYDYEQMAMRLEPDEEIIKANTKEVVNWKKVCEQAGMTDELKEHFYSPGTPYVSLKVLD